MLASDLDTPVGRLRAVSDGEALVRVTWIPHAGTVPPEGDAVSRETVRQLAAYFAGELTVFDLPLRFQGGSAFERDVWQAMRAIPYGETWTYGDLAERIGGVARAVGGACGRNPIPVVVPCHRVVGASGKLVGFSGGDGVESKRQLLDLERGQASLF
ncbi:methylated-DNA--[protein]-cysteine S-methyltransferase [Thalassobaculum sp. OXR-137]|uniref:methylated-DNA--[protein]-cysteine S-methyltransferase n=1 Tax=Thalassobaculum sp. OXR-137 TaxID=3100173 RepID=UPI002AC8B374|nr:methylated-DNA--[protein]-cysteine S-methyltransferase [Thalassobaculum sp. OXR-137]WPZ35483.1 methylated-DNA--[protein]-cysteine S-methyltransferase [Thalassobaculum sp. OXR-137]